MIRDVMSWKSALLLFGVLNLILFASLLHLTSLGGIHHYIRSSETVRQQLNDITTAVHVQDRDSDAFRDTELGTDRAFVLVGRYGGQQGAGIESLVSLQVL